MPLNLARTKLFLRSVPWRQPRRSPGRACHTSVLSARQHFPEVTRSHERGGNDLPLPTVWCGTTDGPVQHFRPEKLILVRWTRVCRPGTMHAQSTQGPSWGYSNVNFGRFFRKRGQFSPNVDKNGETAPRTETDCPHEGPFVVRRPSLERLSCQWVSQSRPFIFVFLTNQEFRGAKTSS